MGTQESANAAVKKPTLTPKAVIHQKFGSKAVYQIEEVLEPIEDGCPGLAVAQKHRCLFRCHLKLPDFSVESGTFKRKKDAEQSAAEMALLKYQHGYLLGSNCTNSGSNISVVLP